MCCYGLIFLCIVPNWVSCSDILLSLTNRGGYIVKPDVIEFWQGQTNRLHDRIVFTRHTVGQSELAEFQHPAEGGWVYQRLSPWWQPPEWNPTGGWPHVIRLFYINVQYVQLCVGSVATSQTLPHCQIVVRVVTRVATRNDCLASWNCHHEKVSEEAQPHLSTVVANSFCPPLLLEILQKLCTFLVFIQENNVIIEEVPSAICVQLNCLTMTFFCVIRRTLLWLV